MQFPVGTSYTGTTWNINIPNTTASNYLANYNAYQTALETQTQAVSNAQAALDQANASLTALESVARPEDIEAAQAQVAAKVAAAKQSQAAPEPAAPQDNIGPDVRMGADMYAAQARDKARRDKMERAWAKAIKPNFAGPSTLTR